MESIVLRRAKHSCFVSRRQCLLVWAPFNTYCHWICYILHAFPKLSLSVTPFAHSFASAHELDMPPLLFIVCAVDATVLGMRLIAARSWYAAEHSTRFLELTPAEPPRTPGA